MSQEQMPLKDNTWKEKIRLRFLGANAALLLSGLLLSFTSIVLTNFGKVCGFGALLYPKTVFTCSVLLCRTPGSIQECLQELPQKYVFLHTFRTRNNSRNRFHSRTFCVILGYPV